MKTAISVPDLTFSRVEVRVEQLGISRSQFYATAAERYLDDLDREGVTEAIDEVVDRVGTSFNDDAVAAGRRTLAAEDGW